MIGHDPNKFRFPWRDGNQFRLLIDGEQFYPVMLEAINTAHASVFLEMYLFTSGVVATTFIDALTAAAGRGAMVCVLLDDFGAGGLNKNDRQRLRRDGVRLRFYNPLQHLRITKLHHHLSRDHRKLLMVDGQVAYTGGAGITDDFARDVDPGDNPKRHWRETMIEVRGPLLADWLSLFLENWEYSAREVLVVNAHATLAAPVALAVGRSRHPASLHVVGTQRGRVTIAQGAAHVEVKSSFVNHARNAQKRIWVATAYFVPSWKIRRALRVAARRGVDVRLLLPGPHTDHPAIRHAGRRFYYGLLRHGVQIFEYQPRFTHAKVSLCDNWASVGSSNIDRWNLYWNLEANQEVDDAPFASQVRQMFEADFAMSREYRLDEWRARPWYYRLQEWFWGGVDAAMSRLIKHKEKD